MEEKRTLRLRYIHSDYVDIAVDDFDKCNLLDILVGLIEESGKIGMFLPEHPTLWYAHNCQSFQLESDDDVLKMFIVFSETKIIKLVIGFLLVGRPPKKRKRAEGEGPSRTRSRVVRCGRCKAFGHNVKTCKGGATARELKEQGIRVQLNKKKKAKEIQSVENVMCSAPSVPASQ